jgi:hypothetical protein
MQAVPYRQRNQQVIVEQRRDIGVVLDTREAFLFGTLVLPDERFMRSTHRRQVHRV